MATGPTPVEHPEVLIVGAGPVGLVLAVELARRSIPLRIIDRLVEPTTQSRAIVVHARSLEMFARLGIVDAIIAAGVRSTGMQVHADGGVIADVPLGTVDSPYPYSITIAQTETERILAGRLSELGVEIERGIELLTLEQHEQGVRSTVGNRDGQRGTIESTWIVGTDGAHSTVRHQLGLTLDGSFVGQRFMMGDVTARYDLPHSSMHMFFSTDAGPLLLFPMVGNRVRIIAEVATAADTTDAAGGHDSAYDPKAEPSLAELQAVAEARMGRVELLSARWLTYFDVHHAQVPLYRKGRAFLAGDAAHVHSPAGGQGMNTGMQDAFNLGWKLASAIAPGRGVAPGRAASHLLDSYHWERHPIAAAVIAQTTALTTMGTLQNRVEAALRNAVIERATRLPVVQAKVAAALEETTVNYRGSSIVAGTSRRQLRPGDAAPEVPGVSLHSGIIAASQGGDANGHVVVTVAPRRTPWSRPPIVAVDPNLAAGLLVDSGETEPADGSGASGREADGREANGTGPHAHAAAVDTVLNDPERAVATRYGLGRDGGIIVVRPDGYIGLIAALGDQAAVSAYFALCGRTAAPLPAHA